MCVSVGGSVDTCVARTCAYTRIHRHHHLLTHHTTPHARPHSHMPDPEPHPAHGERAGGAAVPAPRLLLFQVGAGARGLCDALQELVPQPRGDVQVRFACRRRAGDNTDWLWEGGGLVRVSMDRTMFHTSSSSTPVALPFLSSYDHHHHRRRHQRTTTACASWRKPTRCRPRWWTSLRRSRSRSASSCRCGQGGMDMDRCLVVSATAAGVVRVQG